MRRLAVAALLVGCASRAPREPWLEAVHTLSVWPLDEETRQRFGVDINGTGTPVVSTSKGAEGLLAQNGKDILIADGAQEFAGQVIQLLLDENLRSQISLNPRQLVKSIYDWQIILPHFLHFVDRVTAG